MIGFATSPSWFDRKYGTRQARGSGGPAADVVFRSADATQTLRGFFSRSNSRSTTSSSAPPRCGFRFATGECAGPESTVSCTRAFGGARPCCPSLPITSALAPSVPSPSVSVTGGSTREVSCTSAHAKYIKYCCTCHQKRWNSRAWRTHVHGVSFVVLLLELVLKQCAHTRGGAV